MTRLSFQAILAQVRDANMRRIRDRVLEANKLAKVLSGAQRRRAYAVKHRAANRLAELGGAWLGEGVPSVHSLVGVWFFAGGGVHLPTKDLSQIAAANLLSQARMINVLSRLSNSNPGVQGRVTS